MRHDAVMRWVDGYERAWRARDVDAVEALFTDQARYRFSPYEESKVGHAAIKGFWQDDDDVVFAMRALRSPWMATQPLFAWRCVTAIRSARSTATSGSCDSQTTAEGSMSWLRRKRLVGSYVRRELRRLNVDRIVRRGRSMTEDGGGFARVAEQQHWRSGR